MIKKGFIAGIVTVAIVLMYAVFTEKWSYLYFVSGTLGAISLVLALAYLIDSTILGRAHSFRQKRRAT